MLRGRRQLPELAARAETFARMPADLGFTLPTLPPGHREALLEPVVQQSRVIAVTTLQAAGLFDDAATRLAELGVMRLIAGQPR